jgi:hypothetical protein
MWSCTCRPIGSRSSWYLEYRRYIRDKSAEHTEEERGRGKKGTRARIHDRERETSVFLAMIIG